MIKEVEDCKDKNCDCVKKACPCRRLTQKQYRYLLVKGKIEKDIIKMKAGSAYKFKAYRELGIGNSL